MKTVLYFSTLMAVVCAVPAPSPKPCGPGSNCELVTVNGTRGYRFKSGFEPGSQDYQERFYETSGVARRQDSINTKVLMGETRMQWGCDTDVLAAIRDAIDEVCRSEAGCDSGSLKSFDVRKWEDEHTKPTDAKLNVRIDGKYANQESRDALQEALQATANGEGVTTNEQSWQVAASGFAQHGGLINAEGDCAEMQFPNYVAISRYDGIDLLEEMELHAELVEGEKNCLALTILEAIAGAINPIAGKFFGPTKVLCESEL